MQGLSLVPGYRPKHQGQEAGTLLGEGSPTSDFFSRQWSGEISAEVASEMLIDSDILERGQARVSVRCPRNWSPAARLPGRPRRKATLGIMLDSREDPRLPRLTHRPFGRSKRSFHCCSWKCQIHTLSMLSPIIPIGGIILPTCSLPKRKFSAPLFWLRRQVVIRTGG